jgi:hypothetical protein
MVAALGGAAAVRRPDAVGAHIDAASSNHWLDAAVVPADAEPPAADDDDGLPHCLWTVAGAVAGRVEEPGIAMPCLGVVLDDGALLASEDATTVVETPSLAVLGEVNDRAYGQVETLAPRLRALEESRGSSDEPALRRPDRQTLLEVRRRHFAIGRAGCASELAI